MPRRIHRLFIAAALLAACGDLPLAPVAEPATPQQARPFVVISPGLVSSTADAGPGTLRQVILNAPGGGATTTITFAASLGSPFIGLSSGEIAIADKHIIIDAGESGARINGLWTSRIFNVAASGHLELHGVTLQQGMAAGDGGAILNAGTVELTNSLFQFNKAGGDGGAIANSGTLTLTNTAVTESVGFGDGLNRGGALFSSAGTVTLDNSTLYHNIFDPRGSGFGAAMAVSGGSLTMKGGSISGDLRPSGAHAQNAAGLYVQGGTASLDGVDLYNLIAAGTIGPLYVRGGTLLLTRSRIGLNTVQPEPNGGLIYNDGGTIVARYNQFVGGEMVTHVRGTSDLNDNFWGCNDGPNNPGCSRALGVTPATWLMVRHTPTPAEIALGGTSTLSLDASRNSAGEAIAPANLAIFAGRRFDFVSLRLGTVAPTSVRLDENFHASATFTGSSSEGGLGRAIARTVFSLGPGISTTRTFAAQIQVGPTNAPPAANAGADQTIECAGASTGVTLNGAASSDPDGDALTYEWKEGSTVVASGATPTVPLEEGEHTLTLTVSDGNGGTSSADVTITIADTQPPAITLNGPESLTLEQGGDSYTEEGATAADACAGDVDVQISGSVNTDEAGDYTITYTAADGHGHTATATRLVRVRDTIAPAITVGAAPLTIRPPNHRMVAVSLASLGIGVHDVGSASVGDVVITRVTSDEADNGLGDGDTPYDVVIAADGRSLELRAERAGSGNGRVYVIHLGVRDVAGNIGTATYRVSVPKNAKAPAVMDAVAYTVAGPNP